MTEGVCAVTSSTLLLSVQMNPENPTELSVVVVFFHFVILKNIFLIFFRIILMLYSHVHMYIQRVIGGFYYSSCLSHGVMTP